MRSTDTALPSELPPHHRPIPRLLAALSIAAVVSASTIVGLAAPASAEGEGEVAVENIVPVANDDAYSTPMSTQLVIANPGILGNDVDPDSALTLSTTDKSTIAGTVFINNAGGFTYNPTPGFTGVTSFQYRAREVGTNQQSNWATVTITVVAPGNLPPVTVDDSYTTPFETDLVVAAGAGLLLNDSDPEGAPMVAVSDWVPSVGSFSAYSDAGTFTYVPPAGFSGDATFTYRAFDHVSPGNYATVTITVLPPAQPEPEPEPVTIVAADDLYLVAPASTLVVGPATGVLANDVHSAGGNFDVLQHTAPPTGSFTLLADGSFQWYSPDEFCDDVTFTYVAGDVDLESNVATVTLRPDLGDFKENPCQAADDLPGDGDPGETEPSDTEPGDESNDEPSLPSIPTLPLPTDPTAPGQLDDETELSSTPRRDALAYTGTDPVAHGVGWGALLTIMLGLGLASSRVRGSARA